MIDLDKIRTLALSGGSEDYTGLYELLGELDRFPDASKPAKLAAASGVLSELFNEGLVELFSSIWASGKFDPVPRDRAPKLINDPQSWQLSSEGSEPYLSFATTPAGDAAYRALPAEAFKGLWEG
jgi:hypothetical protein